MPVTVRTFASLGEAASALGSERDARFFGGGTLLMRALNEGERPTRGSRRSEAPARASRSAPASRWPRS
jgi:xanthine dehydrogenase small subunit